MKVEYSKSFIKSVKKLSGKNLKLVQDKIIQVKNAQTLEEITNCKKLIDFEYVYRIRIGNLRAFFIFHVDTEDNTILFEYLFIRGEAYNKENKRKLRDRDK